MFTISLGEKKKTLILGSMRDKKVKVGSDRKHSPQAGAPTTHFYSKFPYRERERD